MLPRTSTSPGSNAAVQRLHIWYGAFLLVAAIFIFRAFYLQVIRQDYYHKMALSNQLKQYEIPAERGVIEAHDGDAVVPLVLNEKLYTLFADPKYIKDPPKTALALAGVTGGNAQDYEKAMKAETRYAVLAKKLTKEQKKAVDKLNINGIGTRDSEYRTYPNGQLASQVLGFVNGDGEGKYGIEQALDNQLKGQPGELKAITDARGVPLVANKDNIVKAAQPGKRVVLTIDLSIQAQLESILKSQYEATHSHGLSAIVMDPNTGAIVAMANYPTYNPTDYTKVTDGSLFNNNAVGSQLEIGSIMKTLTVAAGLDKGVIKQDTTYYDSGSVKVDDATITNVLPLPSHNVSIQDILHYSLNTGVVHVLKEMGGGDINQKARDTWYDYLTNHYQFGKPTGIEQSYEAAGTVPSPKAVDGINIQYANSAFGQGISTTILQMSAALSAAINGGTYYQPHLVDGYKDANGNVQQQLPKITSRNTVRPEVSGQLQQLMEGVFNSNHAVYQSHLHEGFNIGGKTGTAQVVVDGNYSKTKFNGTFLGFVGGDKPQYVVSILNQTPDLPPSDYAGTEAAAPIFGAIVDMLINSGRVTPKT